MHHGLEHPLAPVRVLLGPSFPMLGYGTPFDNIMRGGVEVGREIYKIISFALVRPVRAHRLSHAHYCGHSKPRMLEAAWIAGLKNNRHARSKTCQDTMRNPGPRQRTSRVTTADKLDSHRIGTTVFW